MEYKNTASVLAAGKGTHKKPRRTGVDLDRNREGGQSAGAGPGVGGMHRATPVSLGGMMGMGAEKTGLADLTQMFFFSGRFDIDMILAGNNKKSISALRVELAQLDHRAVEELKRLMHENYHEVVQASQAVLKLENEMQSLRKTITNTSLMLQQLKDLTETAIKVTGSYQDKPLTSLASRHNLWEDTRDGLTWCDLLDELDMAIAERRIPDALELIRQAEEYGEELGSKMQQEAMYNGQSPTSPQINMEELMAGLATRTTALIPVLEQLMNDPTASTAVLRSLTTSLTTVAGKVHALQSLLEAHNGIIKRQQQQVVKPQNAGGADPDGVEYATALAQRTFIGVADALDDVASIFTGAVPELSALVLNWAIAQTTQSCDLLKANCLDQFACPAGLAPTVAVMTVTMSYATSLEVSHSIKLGPTVWKELWGHLEQVLARHLRHLSDDVKAAVEQDIDAMAAPDFPADESVSSWDALVGLFPNLDQFSDDMRQLSSTLLPLAGPQLGSFMRKAISELFLVYTKAMRNGMGRHVQPDGMIPDNMGPAVELLMEGVTLLVERVLPSILGPMSSAVGDVIDVNHLMGLIDNTAAAFGLIEAN